MSDRKIKYVICNIAGSNETFKEGAYGTKNIKYHEPVGPGDQHYVDIEFMDGESARIFNLMHIQFEEEDAE